MERDKAEELLNDVGEWEAHRVVCLKNGWTEKAKEASARKAEVVEKLLAALTNEQRKNCIDIGGGHGLCDMCASGRTDLCRYVNTIGALKEIDGLREKLAALAPETNQPEGTGYYDLTIRVGVYRDSRGYETVTYQNNGLRYLSAETKDITGLWRKVEP